MSWQTKVIDGKPTGVFIPENPRRFGILFLHNAKEQPLSVSEVYTDLLEQHRLYCVCPSGGATWWTDRILPAYDPNRSAETYLIESIVPFMEKEWGLSPPAIGLLGISMGGQGALRLAFKYPAKFPVVAAVAPALDYHEYYGHGSPIDQLYTSKEQCRQDTAGMHLPPSDPPRHVFYCVDPLDHHWHRGADRLHEKMLALGAPHEMDLTTQAGAHSWTYFDAMAQRAIEFIVRGLEAESRKLI
jgi:S-formylglutathione hydrolase FrmB